MADEVTDGKWVAGMKGALGEWVGVQLTVHSCRIGQVTHTAMAGSWWV